MFIVTRAENNCNLFLQGRPHTWSYVLRDALKVQLIQSKLPALAQVAEFRGKRSQVRITAKKKEEYQRMPDKNITQSISVKY